MDIHVLKDDFHQMMLTARTEPDQSTLIIRNRTSGFFQISIWSSTTCTCGSGGTASVRRSWIGGGRPTRPNLLMGSEEQENLWLRFSSPAI
jgi:hypothetical protein